MKPDEAFGAARRSGLRALALHRVQKKLDAKALTVDTYVWAARILKALPEEIA